MRSSRAPATYEVATDGSPGGKAEPALVKMSERYRRSAELDAELDVAKRTYAGRQG